MNGRRNGMRQEGFSMIEVLVSLIIIMVALLGIAALQVRAQIAELEAQQRAIALIMVSDIVDVINTNRETVSCFAFTDDPDDGTPYLGIDGDSSVLSGCAASTSNYNTLADQALVSIDDMLKGAAETAVIDGSTTNVGSLIGARACVSYDATTQLTGQPGTGLFTVAVSWQGMADLVVPAVNCANDLYGTEAKRRTVAMQFRIADLL